MTAWFCCLLISLILSWCFCLVAMIKGGETTHFAIIWSGTHILFLIYSFHKLHFSVHIAKFNYYHKMCICTLSIFAFISSHICIVYKCCQFKLLLYCSVNSYVCYFSSEVFCCKCMLGRRSLTHHLVLVDNKISCYQMQNSEWKCW